MEKLTVTLKQHTPLIHFQHEQEGATLRASEVKPKLDKFIIKYLFDNDFEKCKTYLIGYSLQNEKNIKEKYNSGFKALDYKLSIIPQNEKDVKIPTIYKGKAYFTEMKKNEDFPFLMSNMGGKTNKDELINLTLHDFLILTFNISNNYLYEQIVDTRAVQAFFSKYNFGQRSTKGFGSFSVSRIDNREINWNEAFLPAHTPLMKFSTRNIKNKTLDKQYVLFKTLDFYWKCLKSGINYTRNDEAAYMKIRYVKAYLWHYLNDKGFTWEKKAIKAHFHLLTGRETRENPNPVIFARALLGCPDKFEYRYQDENRIKHNEMVSIKHNEINKDIFISRIPTPIIFKPIIDGDQVTIYILFDPAIRQNLRKLTNLSYQFSCGTDNDLSLKINPDRDCINYKTLFQGYHKYFTTNIDVKSSIFCMPKDDEMDGDDEIDIVDNTMIPRDFNWNNILGNKEIVRFYTT
jgi:hypothetical protein